MKPVFLVALSIYLSIYLSMYLSLYGSTAIVEFGRFFSSLISTQSVGLLGRVISPSQGRYLHTAQHKQNKCIQTSMSRVEFEPMIPGFERAKTVHALDSSATMVSLSSVHKLRGLSSQANYTDRATAACRRS
jgi:hypothetical protein